MFQIVIYIRGFKHNIYYYSLIWQLFVVLYVPILIHISQWECTLITISLRFQSLYRSGLAWDSLLLAFIYLGVVNSFFLVPLTTLLLCLVLSKVVALVVNSGKSQQYKLNEANLCGGHTCVIVDGGLYSFIRIDSSQTMHAFRVLQILMAVDQRFHSNTIV